MKSIVIKLTLCRFMAYKPAQRTKYHGMCHTVANKYFKLDSAKTIWLEISDTKHTSSIPMHLRSDSHAIIEGVEEYLFTDFSTYLMRKGVVCGQTYHVSMWVPE